MSTTLHDLYLEERRQQILDLVNRQGRVSVSDLANRFGVSEVTIRADLQALAEQKLLVRTHGGALPANRGLYDISLSMRRQQHTAEKSRIGEAGAALIANGDAIILDSSSTAFAIAQQIKNHRDVTIITNSLTIAHEMLDVPGITVVMPGGTLQRDTASLVGAWGMKRKLKNYNVEKGFFGAHGITVPEGLTDVSDAEAKVKGPLVSMCRQVIAVADATKWGKIGLASFASVEDVDCIITDLDAPTTMVENFRSLGKEVILV